jgi:hypothetical protein
MPSLLYMYGEKLRKTFVDDGPSDHLLVSLFASRLWMGICLGIDIIVQATSKRGVSGDLLQGFEG